MPRTGDSIENPATGERIVFLITAEETGGELLEMDAFWPRPGHRAAEHVHPEMEERWEVVSGRAGFRIAGDEREASPGEAVVAPPGTPHLAWNAADGPTHVRIQMRPALRWAEFVERLFTGDGELPDLLREFHREIAPPPR
jgi:quercetin dioxygenase-like cupin family protein